MENISNDWPARDLEQAFTILDITLEDFRDNWAKRHSKNPDMRRIYHNNIIFALQSIRFWRTFIDHKNRKRKKA